MKGKRILGIIVVMAMVLTVIPVMAGHARAESGGSNDGLLFFVNKWLYMTSLFTLSEVA